MTEWYTTSEDEEESLDVSYTTGSELHLFLLPVRQILRSKDFTCHDDLLDLSILVDLLISSKEILNTEND
jgi:hypothetical protein